LSGMGKVVTMPTITRVLVHMAPKGQSDEWNKSMSTIRMVCGEQVIVFDDGTTAPPDFDFVVDGYDPHDLVTCPACKNPGSAPRTRTSTRKPVAV
jgi:hypothetical protein